MITMRIEANWQKGSTATHIRAGKHAITVDETAAMGGGDLGPNPLQYLLSALAGCLIGMGKLVARERGLAIDGITCRVEGDLDTDGMLLKNPRVRPGCQEIRMAVTVESDEEEAKLNAWMAEVENRCPIRDCVVNETPVQTFMKN